MKSATSTTKKDFFVVKVALAGSFVYERNAPQINFFVYNVFASLGQQSSFGDVPNKIIEIKAFLWMVMVLLYTPIQFKLQVRPKIINHINRKNENKKILHAVSFVSSEDFLIRFTVYKSISIQPGILGRRK